MSALRDSSVIPSVVDNEMVSNEILFFAVTMKDFDWWVSDELKKSFLAVIQLMHWICVKYFGRFIDFIKRKDLIVRECSYIVKYDIVAI